MLKKKNANIDNNYVKANFNKNQSIEGHQRPGEFVIRHARFS